MFVALYLAHGINARTTTAVLGTVGALFITGVLAWIFVTGTHLTGLASEESGLLAASLSGVSLKGLLLGGIVIGSLGVLDDVTVTQASAVWELHQANPSYGFSRLYAAGLRIGRDHIASTVNTLVMAYAGASLPLLVLFTLSSRQLGDVLTSEILAQEIVRTLVGSIGLISAVPITTALAAFVADRSIHREPVEALLHDYYDGGGGVGLPPVGQVGQAAGQAAQVFHVAARGAQRQAEDEGSERGGRPRHAVSGVAGQVEEQRDRVLSEDGGVAGGHLQGGGRLPEPVIEHTADSSAITRGSGR